MQMASSRFRYTTGSLRSPPSFNGYDFAVTCGATDSSPMNKNSSSGHGHFQPPSLNRSALTRGFPAAAWTWGAPTTMDLGSSLSDPALCLQDLVAGVDSGGVSHLDGASTGSALGCTSMHTLHHGGIAGGTSNSLNH